MIKEYKELLKKINEYEIIYIFRHINPDPDAMGSSFGLKEIILENFPNKKVFVFGENTSILSKIFPLSDVKKDSDHISKKKLAIVCDTANTARIDDDSWKDCDFIVKIDHHPITDEYGHLNLVWPKSPSTCQIVTDFAIATNLKITKKASNHLYTGLITDTGRFLYPNVNDKTFFIAQQLVINGADMQQIYQKLYTRNPKFIKFLGFVYQNITLSNKVFYLLVTKSVMKKYNFAPEEVKLLINVMSNYEEVNVWVLGIYVDDYIKVSIRSKNKYHINKIADKFNGGGHNNAAAAKVSSKTDFMKIINLCQKVKKQ